MSRARQHASAAERQRAYRQRLASRSPGPTRSLPLPSRRALSRPARLAGLQAAVQQLHDEYENWLNSLPESLQDGQQASLLVETVEQLESVLELLSEIHPPRGFGRD
ncbi:MAG: hypothetical protein GX934_13950 [Burkholderiales bacterium]|nr:hypothetical protein [Burkholderiales bacterium]